MPALHPDHLARPVRSSLADAMERAVRERDRDPAHRSNTAAITRQRNAGAGGGRSALGDAVGRSMDEAARENAVEAVADARDELRRLKRADAPRAQVEDAREALAAARQRRDELAR